MRDIRGAGQRHVGLVGVKHPCLTLGDEQSFRIRVGDQFGEVVAVGLTGKLQEPDRVKEHRDQPDDRQKGEEAQHQPASLVLRKKRIGCRGGNQKHRDDKHQQRAAGALRPVDGRARRVAHDRPEEPPRRLAVAADAAAR